MRRRLILLLPPAAATIAVARSPYLAPVLFGARQWISCFRRTNLEYEPEAFG